MTGAFRFLPTWPIHSLLWLCLFAQASLASVPFIDFLSPPSASVGDTPVPLTIRGANFAPDSRVQVDGVMLRPLSLSSSRISVILPASVLATAHTASVTVINPASDVPAPVSNTAPLPLSSFSPSVASTRTFSPVTEPRGIAAGDFNHDGYPDLAVSRWCVANDTICSPGKVLLFTGNGSGALSRPIATDVCERIAALATGDFNADGNLDLAGVCDSGVEILLGDGAGNFKARFLALGMAGRSFDTVTAADFNGDGKLDLLVAGILNGPYLLTGNGYGGFTAGPLLCTCQGGTTVATGDFNGDGKLDAAVAFFYDLDATLLLGDSAGGFTASRIPAGTLGALSATAADFNGDGKLDLAIGYSSDDTAILLGDGAGHFTRGAPPNIPGIGDLASGDFNGDGKIDLAVSSRSTGLGIFAGDGGGHFAPLDSSSLAGAFGPLAIADFNRDGLLDFATVGVNRGSLELLLRLPAQHLPVAYSIADVCAPLSCQAFVLGPGGVVAGSGFAVYPGSGLVDFVRRTGLTFEPWAIDAAGNIVGSAGVLPGHPRTSGFAAIWQVAAAEFYNLDPVFNWTSGVATGINSLGNIVGYSPGAPPNEALVPGVALTSVVALTDASVILGTDAAGPLAYASAIPSPPGPMLTRLPMASLAGAFNSAGQVLVTSPAIGTLFSPGLGFSSQIAAPGFTVRGFNARGQFVGLDGNSLMPALYTGGVVVPLSASLPPASGWTLTGVAAINDSGQILATGVRDGRKTSVLLTPVTGPNLAAGQYYAGVHESP